MEEGIYYTEGSFIFLPIEVTRKFFQTELPQEYPGKNSFSLPPQSAFIHLVESQSNTYLWKVKWPFNLSCPLLSDTFRFPASNFL